MKYISRPELQRKTKRQLFDLYAKIASDYLSVKDKRYIRVKFDKADLIDAIMGAQLGGRNKGIFDKF